MVNEMQLPVYMCSYNFVMNAGHGVQALKVAYTIIVRLHFVHAWLLSGYKKSVLVQIVIKVHCSSVLDQCTQHIM